MNSCNINVIVDNDFSSSSTSLVERGPWKEALQELLFLNLVQIRNNQHVWMPPYEGMHIMENGGGNFSHREHSSRTTNELWIHSLIPTIRLVVLQGWNFGVITISYCHPNILHVTQVIDDQIVAHTHDNCRNVSHFLESSLFCYFTHNIKQARKFTHPSYNPTLRISDRRILEVHLEGMVAQGSMW